MKQLWMWSERGKFSIPECFCSSLTWHVLHKKTTQFCSLLLVVPNWYLGGKSFENPWSQNIFRPLFCNCLDCSSLSSFKSAVQFTIYFIKIVCRILHLTYFNNWSFLLVRCTAGYQEVFLGNHQVCFWPSSLGCSTYAKAII